jgi:glycosyltransferase involved in cell wall biosynthesis
VNSLADSPVLFLSYDGLTDPLGQSQILPYLCGLADMGYAISIISFEKRNRWEAGKSEIEARCLKHKIRWIPLRYHKKPAIVSTLYDLYKLRRKVREIQLQKPFAIVHCRSYLSALIGLWMKRKYGTKFLFDMRGFWADERVEGGLWNIQRKLYRNIYEFFKKRERSFLTEADAVISLTHAAKEYMLQNFGHVSDEKIQVIPCGVDLKTFDPRNITSEQKRSLRQELQLMHDDFVLLYLGSLGTWYLYEDMMRYFEQLKVKYPSAKFLLVTPDGNKVKAAPDIIVREVKRSEVPLYCSIADAAVFFIKPSFSKMASSATKMGEVMAMELPVITNKGWGDVAHFSSLSGDIIFNDMPVDSIPSKHPRIRQFADANLSLHKAVEVYAKTYLSLLKK